MPAADVAGPPAEDSAAHLEIDGSATLPPAPPQAATASSEAPWSVESALAGLSLPPAPAAPPSTPLAFLHFAERLKTTPREGWRRFRIAHGESIADHMYRMAVITMVAPPAVRAAGLDVARCTQLAIVHDMAEALVGDLTPMDNVAKPEKHRRELATMNFLAGTLLGADVGGGAQANGQTPSPPWMAERGAELLAAWDEYEAGETREAVFVKDVDKVELLLQMVEYERRSQGQLDLGEFGRVARGVRLPEMQGWAKDLLKERQQFWAAHGGKTTEGKDVEYLDIDLGY